MAPAATMTKAVMDGTRCPRTAPLFPLAASLPDGLERRRDELHVNALGLAREAAREHSHHGAQQLPLLGLVGCADIAGDRAVDRGPLHEAGIAVVDDARAMALEGEGAQ